MAANVKERFPRWVLLAVVGLLLGANTLNIAADIAAMAEAVRLLVGGSAHVYAVGFGLLCLVLQVFLPYETYVRWLKWLTLALLAYVAVVFSLRIDWPAVLLAVVRPRLDHAHEVLLTVVAVFGTTISPCLFFWQAAQELEGSRVEDPSARNAHEVRRHLRRIKIDTIAGITFSNLIAFFIILSTAATLHTLDRVVPARRDPSCACGQGRGLRLHGRPPGGHAGDDLIGATGPSSNHRVKSTRELQIRVLTAE